MNDRLEQIEARADAATEGPWHAGRGATSDGTEFVHTYEQKTEFLALSLNSGRSYLWLVDNGEVIPAVTGDGPKAEANAVFTANAREDVPYLLALVREQQAQIERVWELARSWESRGEYDMAYSKTMTDEEAAIQILANGAQLVDDARLIRNALNNEGTAMPEQPETLLEDTAPETVFTISLSVADAVDTIEDGLRNASVEDLNTLAFDIWGLLIDTHGAALTATEGAE